MLSLKKWLEDNTVSQTAFAEEIGVKQPTVWEWLNDDCLPSPKNLRRISERTGLSIDELLASEASRFRSKTSRKNV